MQLQKLGGKSFCRRQAVKVTVGYGRGALHHLMKRFAYALHNPQGQQKQNRGNGRPGEQYLLEGRVHVRTDFTFIHKGDHAPALKALVHDNTFFNTVQRKRTCSPGGKQVLQGGHPALADIAVDPGLVLGGGQNHAAVFEQYDGTCLADFYSFHHYDKGGKGDVDINDAQGPAVRAGNLCRNGAGSNALRRCIGRTDVGGAGAFHLLAVPFFCSRVMPCGPGCQRIFEKTAVFSAKGNTTVVGVAVFDELEYFVHRPGLRCHGRPGNLLRFAVVCEKRKVAESFAYGWRGSQHGCAFLGLLEEESDIVIGA